MSSTDSSSARMVALCLAAAVRTARRAQQDTAQTRRTQRRRRYRRRGDVALSDVQRAGRRHGDHAARAASSRSIRRARCGRARCFSLASCSCVAPMSGLRRPARRCTRAIRAARPGLSRRDRAVRGADRDLSDVRAPRRGGVHARHAVRAAAALCRRGARIRDDRGTTARRSRAKRCSGWAMRTSRSLRPSAAMHGARIRACGGRVRARDVATAPRDGDIYFLSLYKLGWSYYNQATQDVAGRVHESRRRLRSAHRRVRQAEPRAAGATRTARRDHRVHGRRVHAGRWRRRGEPLLRDTRRDGVPAAGHATRRDAAWKSRATSRARSMRIRP